MENKNKLIMSILIISVLLIGTAWSEPSDLSENDFVEFEELPEYSQTAFKERVNNPEVVDTRGNMPNIEQEAEKRKWVEMLDACGRLSVSEIESYMLANGGPLVSYGYDINGTLVVSFNKDSFNELDKSTIDEIYSIIDLNSKKANLSDIPVVFDIREVPKEDSRTSYWRPLIGGIIIEPSCGTLSFAAKDRTTGEKGFVMSGHAGYNVGIGGSIYQPSSSYYRVGTVYDIGGVYADAAWVKTTSVTPKVYDFDTDVLKYVTSYGDPQVGWGVYKSGVATGRTAGTVQGLSYTVSSSTFGILYDQYYATYSSTNGDSGSPVYAPEPGGVELLGVHWGSTSSYAYFSPISGVHLDLGVVPIVY